MEFIANVCTANVCIARVCIVRVGIARVCIARVCIARVCTARVCIARVCSARVGAGLQIKVVILLFDRCEGTAEIAFTSPFIYEFTYRYYLGQRPYSSTAQCSYGPHRGRNVKVRGREGGCLVHLLSAVNRSLHQAEQSCCKGTAHRPGCFLYVQRCLQIVGGRAIG